MFPEHERQYVVEALDRAYDEMVDAEDGLGDAERATGTSWPDLHSAIDQIQASINTLRTEVERA